MKDASITEETKMDVYYYWTDALLRMSLLFLGIALGMLYMAFLVKRWNDTPQEEKKPRFSWFKRKKEEEKEGVEDGSTRATSGELVLRHTEEESRPSTESRDNQPIHKGEEDKPEGIQQAVQYPQKQYRGLVTVEKADKGGLRKLISKGIRKKGNLPPPKKQ